MSILFVYTVHTRIFNKDIPKKLKNTLIIRVASREENLGNRELRGE